MSLLDLALERAWACDEGTLRTIWMIADRQHDPSALLTRPGERPEGTRRTTLRDGVAVLDVNGPMFRRANLLAEVSGATSYEILGRDFQAALDDPSVHSIALHVASPGGTVDGTSELAESIFQARGTKPIVAYAAGQATSAAFWIATAADEIVASDTATLGSIGVRGGYRDRREADKKAGVEEIEIISSQTPKKALDPKTDDGRREMQRLVDGMAEVFIGAVARNRGLSEDAVMERFGDGRVEIGQRAVEVGMADRLGTLEGVIAGLVADHRQRRQRSMFAAPSRRGPTMANQTDTPSAEAGQDTPQATSTPPALTAETVARDHPAVAEALRAEGAERERARVAEIEAQAVTGYEDIIAECKADPTCDGGEAAKRVTAAIRADQQSAHANLAKDETAGRKPAAGGAAAATATDPHARAAAEIVAAGRRT